MSWRPTKERPKDDIEGLCNFYVVIMCDIFIPQQNYTIGPAYGTFHSKPTSMLLWPYSQLKICGKKESDNVQHGKEHQVTNIATQNSSQK